jgi:hypothetical protein
MTGVHYPRNMSSTEAQSRNEKALAHADRIFAKSEFGFIVLGFAYLGLYSLDVLLDPPAEIARAIRSASLVIYVIFVTDLIAHSYPKFLAWENLRHGLRSSERTGSPFSLPSHVPSLVSEF